MVPKQWYLISTHFSHYSSLKKMCVFFFFFFPFFQGISLDFGFFPELGFLNFFFFGGVIAGYYIAPLAPTKKVVLCEAVIFFCGGNEAKNFLGIL